MKILATALLFIALLPSSETFAGSVDYCVTIYEDGTQECGPHVGGLGYDCTTVIPTKVNGKRVKDVYIVSKSECNQINNTKNTSPKKSSSDISQTKSCEDIYFDLWDKCLKKCGAVSSSYIEEGSREYSCVESCFAKYGCKP